MLILARRRTEEIIINEELIIRVNKIDYGNNQVSLQFEGNKDDYVIDRYEIYLRNCQGKQNKP